MYYEWIIGSRYVRAYAQRMVYGTGRENQEVQDVRVDTRYVYYGRDEWINSTVMMNR